MQSTRVLVAGLAVQVVALALFVMIHAWIALSLRDSQPDPQHAGAYRAPKFKRFLLSKSCPPQPNPRRPTDTPSPSPLRRPPLRNNSLPHSRDIPHSRHPRLRQRSRSNNSSRRRPPPPRPPSNRLSTRARLRPRLAHHHPPLRLTECRAG